MQKDASGKILPLFKYADEKASKANYLQFDKAIEKTNKVIQWHSILIDGTEHARWIDANYITCGKAHFYKRDYYMAVTVFEYVVKVFPNKPSKYEAFLWLVRCYNQMNSVIKTGPILDLLKQEKLPKHLVPEYYAVLSDYNLRTEQYKKAEESLLKAIAVTKNKHVRGRYWYILGQLHEQDGNLKKASEEYYTSAKLHPSFEMEFNAQLAQARTFQIKNGEDSKAMKKTLNKMLKDGKNHDFRDQIYYALADISFREKDVPTALNYFKLSAQSSVTNTRQKAVSYLRAADIYFDKRDYKNAQLYYDSTMVFLPKDFKNYDLLKNKHESLTAMIKDISTIEREDSLLQIASMDTSKISKLLDEIIAKVKAEEEKKKKEQEAKANQPKSNSASLTNENNPWGNQNQTGTWYFYNQQTVSFGFAEFFKKWGNRPLEDNWRRASKEVVMQQQQEVDTTAKKDTASKKIPENQTYKFYLKNLPFSDEAKEKSKNKIVDAYYDLGGIYKEDLQDNTKAAETFEELLKSYPDNKYTLNLYYQLYRLYLAVKNTERSDYYKNKILKEHPDSEYAKIILNPDYQKALLASKNEIQKFYGEAFSAYKNSQYEQAIAMANKADTFYSTSDLMPKFAMLRAFSIGKTKGSDDYEKALQGVIAKYPKDDAKKKAQELLDYMKKMKSAPVDTASAKKDTVKLSPYTFKDSAEHYCIVLLPAKKVNIEDFKVRVSNFDSKYFSTSDLNINNVLLDLERQIVVVKSFPLASKAKDYYDLINQDADVFKEISPQDYKVFPISADNYTIFFKEKNIPEYEKFFKENYKKKADE